MSDAPPWVRIGNQTAHSAPLFAPFDFAVRHGFDAFEWFPDRLPDGTGRVAAYLTAAQRQDVRSRARDAGIRLSVHAPIPADPLRPNDRDLEDSLRLAVDLGAAILNIHFADPRRTEEFASALGPWVQRCSISGVRLALENVPHVGPDDCNQLFALLPRNGAVGMTLDVGHANLHPATIHDYIAYLDRLRHDLPIIHLHLHENWGDADSHLVVFTGPAGRDPSGLATLFDRLRQRGFSGNVVMEQWPQPPELLVQARDRLEEMVRGGRP
jgi:sugar phosphate isomerase/epimerase